MGDATENSTDVGAAMAGLATPASSVETIAAMGRSFID
jgi:hypothetical protein